MGRHGPDGGIASILTSCSLDPYAKAIAREKRGGPMKCGAYKLGDPQADLSLDERDDAATAPLGVVLDEAFTYWGDDRRTPQIPWNKTIIYEMHVKGFHDAAMPKCPKSSAALMRVSAPTRPFAT